MKEHKPRYQVRWAKENDWAPAMTMIWKTFLEFEGKEYSEEGVRNFFDFITDDDLYISFLEGEYQLMVALEGRKVVGAASVRNRHHLSLLFVDKEYHMRGIGKNLMETLFRYLKEEAGEELMSVTAAPYAVDFYRKLGFRAIAPESTRSGITVTPMEKRL